MVSFALPAHPASNYYYMSVVLDESVNAPYSNSADLLTIVQVEDWK